MFCDFYSSSRFLRIPKIVFEPTGKNIDDIGFEANPSTRKCVLRCYRDWNRENVRKNVFFSHVQSKRQPLPHCTLVSIVDLIPCHKFRKQSLRTGVGIRTRALMPKHNDKEEHVVHSAKRFFRFPNSYNSTSFIEILSTYKMLEYCKNELYALPTRWFTNVFVFSLIELK